MQKRSVEVFLFRHGETDWNRAGRFQGSSDILLNANGVRQAQKLREYFAQNPVDLVLTSDLMRARQTAAIALPAVPFRLARGIRETNLGGAEGLTKDEVVHSFGSDAWKNWYTLGNEGLDFRFPRGESKREHVRRIVGTLQAHLDQVVMERARPFRPRVAISTHGGVLRRFIHHLHVDLIEPVSIPNCVVYRGLYFLGGKWSLNLTPDFFVD